MNPNISQPLRFVLAFTLLAVSVTASAAPTGAQWAILIGCEDYEKATPLMYTVNDVNQLSATLHQRGGYDSDNILKIVDKDEKDQIQPNRKTIIEHLPKFLAKQGDEDLVIVYFSGHGFRDKEGALYLAPIDCDPKNPEPTGVSVAWFREQIVACKAKHKLLIIDACHAGAEKGEDENLSVPAKDLMASFQDVPGVATLASSTGSEKSQIWAEKRQSLFSYWLNQGLKGHADRDGNSQVTIDELYNYVHASVTRTARERLGRSQTPVRHIRGGIGVAIPMQLKPQSLDTVLADMAEQLAWALEEQKLTSIGVLEFTNDTKFGELLGADFGMLGKTCQLTLERRLTDLRGTRYNVVSRRKLQSALRAQQIGIDDLGDSDTLTALAKRAGGMPAIAVGTLRHRRGAVVTLSCELLKTDTGDVGTSVGGTAALTESQWAELGISAKVEAEDRRPERVRPDAPVRPITHTVIERLDRRSEAVHPLLDPRFPYRIEVVVDGKVRKPVVRGNEMFIPLRKGEVYLIRVENRLGKYTYLQLLVDGLNTLPQPMPGEKGIVTTYTAAPVSLEYARPWILDPKKRPTNKYAFKGFFSTLGKGAKYNEFTVVDAQDSLAARQQFTDQIGIITAAFYAPKGGARTIGTTGGKEGTTNVELVKHPGMGNLLAVVHIRYCEPEAIEDYSP